MCDRKTARTTEPFSVARRFLRHPYLNPRLSGCVKAVGPANKLYYGAAWHATTASAGTTSSKWNKHEKVEADYFRRLEKFPV